jgi:hypothetical protein
MSFTFEIESAAPAARLFKAAGIDWHNLGPKLAPEKIVSAVVLDGEGNVGSVRQFNFGAGNLFLLEVYLNDRSSYHKMSTNYLQWGYLYTTVPEQSRLIYKSHIKGK